MVVELEPNAPKNSHSFRVENNGQERIAVQLKMASRTSDENGKESRVDTTDFSIYPEQISLSPNDMRTIRITYTGSKDVNTEKAYRLIAAQLPVQFQKQTKPTQLNFLFQYIASVYVTPKGAVPQIQINKIKALSKNKIEFYIENIGTAHRLLKGVEIQLFANSEKPIALDSEFFKAITNENILANSSRKFVVATKENIDPKMTITGKVKITE